VGAGAGLFLLVDFFFVAETQYGMLPGKQMHEKRFGRLHKSR